MQINFSFLKKLNDYLKLNYKGKEELVIKILKVSEMGNNDGALEPPSSKPKRINYSKKISFSSSELTCDSLIDSCCEEVQKKEAPRERRLNFSFSDSDSFKRLIDNRGKTFSEKLFELIDKKGLNEVEVYTKANLDRRLFSKLRRREHTPSKNTVFALIVGMELNMAEAKELLSYAGYAFKPSSAVDMIVSFFIEEGEYDMIKLNMVLDKYGLELLGNIVL